MTLEFKYLGTTFLTGPGNLDGMGASIIRFRREFLVSINGAQIRFLGLVIGA